MYGSNVGYANFGDILQLKSQIGFHKTITKRNPVLMLRIDAPYGFSKDGSNKDWYEVEHIIYMSNNDHGSSYGNLVKIPPKSAKPQLMHIYGGGFLNEFWGKTMLGEIIDSMSILMVKDYYFSGQQVSQPIAKYIGTTLKDNPPLLFGTRDRQSYDFMKASAIAEQTRFSFDDIIEIFQLWISNQHVGLKTKIRSKASSSVAWHYNTTGYVAEKQTNLLDTINTVKVRQPGLNCILLQAYNDPTGEAMDTLQTTVALEGAFPYTSYKVVNLAQMALSINMKQGLYPDVAGLLAGVRLAVTSSYHTAMFCAMLGIPSFLLAANGYYSQKQKALGFGEDLNKFAKSPRLRTSKLSSQIHNRQEWLNEITATLEGVA
jgi:exopolysaccharide biosynthesis predicted pyruvyltransferase EpsI